MAALTELFQSPSVRPLVRFGSGVGIAVEGGNLEICLSRVRPGHARLLGCLSVENFRQRPASEWGREYAAFLAAHQSSHLAAWLVLPRHDLIVRHLRLPGVSDADAPAAIAFQLDSLHPFAEEEVAFDLQRVGRTASFLVAVAPRRVIDSYTALFAEAGVKLAGLTFSGSAVFVSSRLFQPPPAGGFLAVRPPADASEPLTEVYGESPAYPLFSAVFDAPAERAAPLAAAELRLEPDAPALAWAASLAAACPHLGAPLNLLPAGLRASSSRAQYVPTAVLAAALLLLAGALAAENAWSEKEYLEILNAEAARLAPQAQKVEKLDRDLASAVQRIELLDKVRRRTRGHLDILLELTQIIEPPGLLNSLQITPDQVTLSGESDKADELLKKLEASPRFTAAEFTAPLTRGNKGDIFRIRARREADAP
jgi:Tfp pilus assembly protein PilN